MGKVEQPHEVEWTNEPYARDIGGRGESNGSKLIGSSMTSQENERFYGRGSRDMMLSSSYVDCRGPYRGFPNLGVQATRV